MRLLAVIVFAFTSFVPTAARADVNCLALGCPTDPTTTASTTFTTSTTSIPAGCAVTPCRTLDSIPVDPTLIPPARFTG